MRHQRTYGCRIGFHSSATVLTSNETDLTANAAAHRPTGDRPRRPRVAGDLAPIKFADNQSECGLSGTRLNPTYSHYMREITTVTTYYSV